MNWTKATDEEWKTYYKVRRERTMWDIAGYCHWNITDLNNNPYVHEGYNPDRAEEDDDDTIYTLNECELMFMCEYVEDFFTTETTIFDLIDEAYNIVLHVRCDDFTGIETSRNMERISRLIFPYKYKKEK